VTTIRRQAARAVVLDRLDRVLLIRAHDPFSPGKGEWWELPGGGMEPGEASASAAAREVHEETGLSDVDVGPCVWQHDARFTFAGMRFDQLEHIHVARWRGAGEEMPYRPGGLEMIEAMAFSGFSWWTPADLVELQRSGGRIIPPWLPDELPRFLADGPPAEPNHLGELGPVF
jgi:8-oxo-dGTP pyrophosphatase MutT (NUDIX family)